MRDKKKLIEAALFIAARPMTLAELYHVVGIPKPNIKKLIKEMEKEYDEHGISVREKEDYYEIHIKDEYKPHVEHLAPEKDFSKATLQTLSLIAYHNPAKQSFVVETRGNRAYDHIKELSSRGFIRLEPEGHTNRIHITKKFLDYFDLSSPSQLKEYFSDKGIEPPDEAAWEETVNGTDSKNDSDEKKPVEEPESIDSNHGIESVVHPEGSESAPNPPKEAEEPVNINDTLPGNNQEEEKEPDFPKEEESDIEKKKKNKTKLPKKKSVNIKDEPYKSPFSDILKDDDE